MEDKASTGHFDRHKSHIRALTLVPIDDFKF